VLEYLDLLEPSQMEAAYAHLIALFDGHELAELYTPEFAAQLRAEDSAVVPVVNGCGDGEPYLHRLLRLQYAHWLPENMLLRADKLSMAHSVEARVPFLDHTLIAYCQTVPPHLKVRGLTGKYLLRKVAAELLPEPAAKRKKRPFYMPIERFFRTELFRELAGDLLGEASIRRRGIFRPQVVRQLLERMHEREFLYVKQVFALLVMEIWMREFLDKRPAAASLPEAVV
jgi:asparagine synthase (glutamine-hydrolysing)